ncbi:hypothetical protein C8Q72DRAFT_934880 [Fomitopsis betulina]|nr:hypothetical protein C8Q72DRAFT_934880 [Fomitopsis betulina]
MLRAAAGLQAGGGQAREQRAGRSLRAGGDRRPAPPQFPRFGHLHAGQPQRLAPPRWYSGTYTQMARGRKPLVQAARGPFLSLCGRIARSPALFSLKRSAAQAYRDEFTAALIRQAAGAAVCLGNEPFAEFIKQCQKHTKDLPCHLRAASLLDDESAQKEDPGKLVLAGYSAGSCLRPAFDWSRNLLSKKHTEQFIRTHEMAVSSNFALFFNSMDARLPNKLLADLREYLQSNNLCRMDGNQAMGAGADGLLNNRERLTRQPSSHTVTSRLLLRSVAGR